MEGSSTADHPTPRATSTTMPRSGRSPVPSKKLDHEGHTTNKGQRIERYRCHWRDCPVRAQCTRDPKGRQLEVRPQTPHVQAMRERLQHHRPGRCGAGGVRSLNAFLPRSNSTRASAAGRCGAWTRSKPSGPCCARRSTCGCSIKTGGQKRETRPAGAQRRPGLSGNAKKRDFAPTTAIRHMAGRRSPLVSSTFFAPSNLNQPKSAKNF